MMTNQAHGRTDTNPSPQHQEKEAKQTWDDEGGSLHPDETPGSVPLDEPVKTGEHAAEAQNSPGDVHTVYATDDEPGDQPS